MSMGFAVLGGVMSAVGSMKQAKASAKAEKLRSRMMQLEAMRKRRELIREGVVANATAKSNATAQGAGEGSALQGGIAQITNQQNRNVLASRQDEELGKGVFKANAAYAKAGGLISIGQGLSQLSSAFSGN